MIDAELADILGRREHALEEPMGGFSCSGWRKELRASTK